MTRAHLTGMGFHVPERVVRNADLEKLMDTSDEWIVERTGIRERRFVQPGTGTTDLALEAARRALDDAGRTPRDVEFIVFATITRDQMFPGCGTMLQQALGIGTIGALEVHNACSGFVYAVAAADAFIRAGSYRRILVVGAEIQSTGLNMSTAGRDMAVLLGDGAGAVLREAGDESRGVLASVLHGDGAHVEDLWAEAPTSKVMGRLTPEMLAEGRMYPRMNGRNVFKHAVTRFPEAIHEALDACGLRLEEVALIVPHQANARISEAGAERLGVPSEKVFQNIERYGNPTAASIPIALAEAKQQGRIRTGDLVVLAAFGAGFAWGASVIRL